MEKETKMSLRVDELDFGCTESNPGEIGRIVRTWLDVNPDRGNVRCLPNICAGESPNGLVVLSDEKQDGWVTDVCVFVKEKETNHDLDVLDGLSSLIRDWVAAHPECRNVNPFFVIEGIWVQGVVFVFDRPVKS